MLFVSMHSSKVTEIKSCLASAMGTGRSLINSYWHCCRHSAAVTFDTFMLD